MEYGAHLPLIAFDGVHRTLADLRAYARSAAELGFTFLTANDHIRFPWPWFDGLTALTAVIEDAADMTLATSICLPVIRGPMQTGKSLAAIDHLCDGRLVAGVGPGSSARDYEAVGIPFDERWRRFDDAIPVMREFLREEGAATPIWIASWGSAAGLRRVARLGDGWLASGYNTTPARFADALAGMPDGLPNGIATMWMYITEDPREAERITSDLLVPILHRPPDTIAELSLPIGSPEACAEHMQAFADAGAERVFVWPLGDDLRQLELFRERVVPLVA
jgi:alkanesulfonate monooxygenase SsuD/methylene tetrahydromethanopterin reductase-like flavin-dependent oxidoreductase (luciferase family)